ncbi:MAG: hypothetical protein WCF52_05560, partial [Pseudolabrys sp.]
HLFVEVAGVQRVAVGVRLPEQTIDFKIHLDLRNTLGTFVIFRLRAAGMYRLDARVSCQA